MKTRIDDIALVVAGESHTARARRNYLIFAIVAVTIGWLGVALDEATGAPPGDSIGMGLWIVVPAITALLLHRLRPDGGGSLGLTLRFPDRARWFALAATFYAPFTAIVVLAGIAAGVASFRTDPGGATTGLLAAVATAVPALFVKNILEELIWRGYGTPTALATGIPRLWSHVLVGVTWGLWHLPLYAVFMTRADFRATTSLGMPLFLVLFFAGVIATAVIYGELRLRTGSIWPGVVLHTIGGAIVGPLLLDGYVRFEGHADAFFSPAPNSIASVILLGLVGLVLVRRPSSAFGRTG